MYAVHYVSDEDLPTNQAWAMVRQGGRVCLFLKESVLCPTVLEEAWAAFRVLEPRAPRALPAQQRRSVGALALQDG